MSCHEHGIKKELNPHDLQILHSNAQPNEFKDMQLTWKILIVFYQSLNEDKDKLYYTLETKT